MAESRRRPNGEKMMRVDDEETAQVVGYDVKDESRWRHKKEATRRKQDLRVHATLVLVLLALVLTVGFRYS